MNPEEIMKDTPILTINYDNSIEEIEQTMKLFNKKLNFKRNISFSIVYLIFIAICIYMIGTNSSGQLAVLALFLCIAFLFNLWFSPFQKRAKLIKQLAGMKQELYCAEFYQTRLEVQTVFADESDEVVDEGKLDDLAETQKTDTTDSSDDSDSLDYSDTLDSSDNQLALGEKLESDESFDGEPSDSQPVKSIYDYTLYSPVFVKTDELFLISLGGHYVHCFPKRCLNDEQIKKLDEYYDNFA